jgi:hypothetical protein
VEEIASISIERTPGVWDDEVLHTDISLLINTFRRARRAASILAFDRSRLDDSSPATEEGRTAERLAMERNLLRKSVPSSLDGFCEPILRISTLPEGFNRGQSYYFLLRAQDVPCLDDSGPIPLRTRADADALAVSLAVAAARRRGDHARETRFLRLQRRLRRAWESIPFNLAVLVLIVSNFVFTVHQAVYLSVCQFLLFLCSPSPCRTFSLPLSRPSSPLLHRPSPRSVGRRVGVSRPAAIPWYVSGKPWWV